MLGVKQVNNARKKWEERISESAICVRAQLNKTAE